MPSPLDHGEQAILLRKTRAPDGMGGYTVQWEDELEFTALITLDSSVEARVAAQSNVIDNYSIFVEKTLPVESGDYFKRESDNAVFRVTSSPNEDSTPDISTMDVKTFTAARSTLPAA